MSSPKRHSSRLKKAGATLCGLLLLLLLAPLVSEAAAQARLEPGSLSQGGPITLDIESENAPSGTQPDLAPLQKDFVALGTATQSETSFVNGRRSDRMRWSVRLQPRHAGKLVIPPITVGSEQTASLDVDVGADSPQAAAQVAKHVFVEVEGGDAGRPVYVQQQAPYTVRLFYDDRIQKGELDAPNPADSVVEQLGADKHGTAIRDGHSYNVLERNYAIAPEKSGSLRIPPVSFNGSIVLPQSGQAQAQGDEADAGDDLFARMLRQSQLGNDPLFKNFAAGSPFGDAAQPVAAQGKEIVLGVRPRPAAARADWLPAEAITLHDSWQDNPPDLKAGEPATRTITVEAKGLSASQIPSLSLAQPANARLYPEPADNQSRTDGKTIFGISTQKVTYIPNAQGTLDVPAVELAWWNVGDDAPRKATLPAHAFSVAPGVAGGAAARAPAGLASPMPGVPASANRTPAGGMGEAWGTHDRRVELTVVSLLVALLVALGIAVGRRRRPGRDGDGSNVAAAPTPSKASGLRTLGRACSANDRDAAANALLELARLEWPADPPRGLGTLASRIGQGAAEVRSLERSLYAAGEVSPWRGDALWRSMRRGLLSLRDDASPSDAGLRSLYAFGNRSAGGRLH